MNQRNSNIELLRIIAMLMIINLHYFASCNAGINTTIWSSNWRVFQFMESLGICGVNIFVLITGFFSLKQDNIRIRKIVNLLLDVAFWGGVGFLLCVLVGWTSFDLKELIKATFPILFGSRWFVKAYIVLLCLIPFLNRILISLTKRSYQILLIILFLLFSIWPSFLPSPPIDDYGYSFIHFIVLYVIAGYIRLHITKYPSSWFCLLGFVVNTIIVCISSMIGQGYAWAYNYLFVILQSVFLLLLFEQIHLKSELINKFAACAFGVFLIHTNSFFSNLIYAKLLHCNDLVNGNWILFLLGAIISMPMFYVVGFVLESLKKRVFAVSLDCLLDKISLLNKPIEIETKENEY